MSHCQPSSSIRDAGPVPPAAAWRSWPLVEHPFWALGVLVGWGGLGWLVWITTAAPHLVVLALAAVALAGWRFYVPVTFELNAEGIHYWIFGRHRCVSWQSVGRYQLQRSGVLVFPLGSQSPADAFRALFIPWGSKRQLVLSHLEHYLGPERKDR